MKALVVFSGGQDSTTCLGWAKNRFDDVRAITFVYGQKHDVEVRAATGICQQLNVPQFLADVTVLKYLVNSALVVDGDVNEKHPDHPDLPASFVPNRNALFLTLAHAYAQKIGCRDIVAGMCQTDYSGYPDCREVFVLSMQQTLNMGSDWPARIWTPLMHLTKAETFLLAEQVGVLDLVIEESHTCYNGDRSMNDWGRGCDECPACKLRKKGWEEFRNGEPC